MPTEVPTIQELYFSEMYQASVRTLRIKDTISNRTLNWHRDYEHLFIKTSGDYPVQFCGAVAWSSVNSDISNLRRACFKHELSRQTRKSCELLEGLMAKIGVRARIHQMAWRPDESRPAIQLAVIEMLQPDGSLILRPGGDCYTFERSDNPRGANFNYNFRVNMAADIPTFEPTNTTPSAPFSDLDPHMLSPNLRSLVEEFGPPWEPTDTLNEFPEVMLTPPEPAPEAEEVEEEAQPTTTTIIIDDMDDVDDEPYEDEEYDEAVHGVEESVF